MATAKPILTRADMIAFYIAQAYEQASWARPKRRRETLEILDRLTAENARILRRLADK